MLIVTSRLLRTLDRVELARSMDKPLQLRRLREEAPANNFRHVRHRAAALAVRLACGSPQGSNHISRTNDFRDFLDWVRVAVECVETVASHFSGRRFLVLCIRRLHQMSPLMIICRRRHEAVNHCPRPKPHSQTEP